MKYAEKNIRYFLEKLAAKEPVPGGGSVAALFAASGCALLSMIGRYALAKEGFNGYKERAKAALAKSEKLRKVFTALIDEDIVAYERLSKALKRYRGNAGRVQPSVRKAASVPMKVCTLCNKAAKICLDMAYVGSGPIISDVSVSMFAIDAAFEAALVNVEANLKLLRDRKYAAAKGHQLKILHRDIKNIKNDVLVKIRERTVS